LGDSRRESIAGQTEEIAARRQAIGSEVNAQTEALHELESRHAELQAETTEHRVSFAEVSQKLQHLDSQCLAAKTRLEELEAVVAGRSRGLQSYESSIEALQKETGDAEARLASLRKAVEDNGEKADSLRSNRQKQSEELAAMEESLAGKRGTLEQLRNTKSDAEIRCTESRMRRQNVLDRVTSEYRMTPEQIAEEPEPEWEQGRPTMDVLETNVTELRTKLEAMGPVNLVAIEEYKDLEERCNFLTQQESDLVAAKQQLLDMIRKINKTTSEMFRSTFEAVNDNFQTMFKKLFNGGSAKLVLVNEEDVLECGIEIIARPPGKRLQNISLLSGGERTLTAVSLLFAIYMIKPSPFCLLDEIDAALDDSNIGRFVAILQDFLQQSQFVVITHNRQTIAAADILYGITMPEKGVSKIVSMRFHDHAPVAE